MGVTLHKPAKMTEVISMAGAEEVGRERLPVTLLLPLFEFCGLVLASLFSDWLYHALVLGEPASDLWLGNGIVVACMFILLQSISSGYGAARLITRTPLATNMLRDWLLTLALVLILSFLSKNTAQQSRGALLVFGGTGYLVLLALRRLTALLLSQAAKTARFVARQIVLVGSRQDVTDYFCKHKLWARGIRVVATLIIRSPTREPRYELWINDSQSLCTFNDLSGAVPYLRRIQLEDVVLALPWSGKEQIRSVLDTLSALPAALYLAPDPDMDFLTSGLGGQPGLSDVLNDPDSGLCGIRLARRPMPPLSRLAKRLFDIALSATGLIILSPLMLLIAVAIRLETPGAPIFRQLRNGFNERPFHIYKFRTMHGTPEKGTQTFQQTRRNDARLTRVGAFLRRTNLDELPQLLNVLAGSMSLVGPRPHAIAHNNEFMTRIAWYASRHHVKPGITGWAQVNGLRGAANDTKTMQARIEHDLQYIRNWSFALDLKILFFTFFSPKAFANAF